MPVSAAAAALLMRLYTLIQVSCHICAVTVLMNEGGAGFSSNADGAFLKALREQITIPRDKFLRDAELHSRTIYLPHAIPGAGTTVLGDVCEDLAELLSRDGRGAPLVGCEHACLWCNVQ